MTVHCPSHGDEMSWHLWIVVCSQVYYESESNNYYIFVYMLIRAVSEVMYYKNVALNKKVFLKGPIPSLKKLR